MLGEQEIGNLLFNLAVSVITVLLALLIRDKLFHNQKRQKQADSECETGVRVVSGGSQFCKDILNRCTRFRRYDPVTFWGKNGHIQSGLHACFGRFGYIDVREQEQKSLQGTDGATLTYDVFTPESPLKKKSDAVILIVPGIGNHARTKYVQAFTYYLVNEGFMVAIVNHLGARADIKLTSPRIFSYGGTEDLCLIVNDILQRYPSVKIIGLGFSMGANVLMKFLGEHPHYQKHFMVAASICQGYDIERAAPIMSQWAGFRRGYNWIMSQNLKRILEQHKDSFLMWRKQGKGPDIDWDKVSKATSLQDLDNAANKFMAGYDTVEEYYHKCSSSLYLNSIKLPLLFVNACDDPIVPKEMLSPPLEHIDSNPDAVCVLTKYGGHLGFFQGGIFSPTLKSWLDEALTQFVLVSYDLLSGTARKSDQTTNGNQSLLSQS